MGMFFICSHGAHAVSWQLGEEKQLFLALREQGVKTEDD